MSVHRVKDNRVAFECDNCREGFESTRHNFRAALEEAKAEGWVTRKRGEDWKHFCSEKCENEDFRRI